VCSQAAQARHAADDRLRRHGVHIQNKILLVYGARPKAIDMCSNLQQQRNIGPHRELRVAAASAEYIGVTVLLMVGLSLFLGRTSYGVQMRARTRRTSVWRAIWHSGRT